jgi:hypothetical protein
MSREQNSQAVRDDWQGPVYQSPEVAKPPFPAGLMKEARRQVDLEEAVRWERNHRGLPKDGIDDWKRRSIIYAYLTMIVIAVFAYVGLVLN